MSRPRLIIWVLLGILIEVQLLSLFIVDCFKTLVYDIKKHQPFSFVTFSLYKKTNNEIMTWYIKWCDRTYASCQKTKG